MMLGAGTPSIRTAQPSASGTIEKEIVRSPNSVYRCSWVDSSITGPSMRGLVPPSMLLPLTGSDWPTQADRRLQDACRPFPIEPQELDDGALRDGARGATP